MNWKCRWSKQQTAKAKADGKGLFAVAAAADGGLSGRMEIIGIMDEARCAVLFCFGQALSKGLRPQEALDEAMGRLTDKGREMLATRAELPTPVQEDHT